MQPLPPREAQQLSDALGRLARDADNTDAMLDAGEAALGLGDIDAAIGFFGRAKQNSPNNSRVTLGLARAYVASRKPVEALRFFAEAERAGVAQERMAAERGLAFDLIGDSASAQSLYRLALAGTKDEEVVRRLALSQAIGGNREGFEATLLPLLENGDHAAFRTRAFGLAILGDTQQAVKIARDMMQPNMAARIEPYLRYMTRLTPAQQAAAGNLGVFPSSGSVGRDTPTIANANVPPLQAAARPSPMTQPDRQLAPSGPPMGTPSPATTPTAIVAAAPAMAASQAAPPEPTIAEPEPSVAEAFANFGSASARPLRSAGAVDITKITVPREAKPAPPPPPPPKVPARSWVQVATGKDRDALKFDWRRISRKADGELTDLGPFVTKWGEANRLLAGPYPSAKAAKETVAKLKAMGIDSFTFDSAEGEAIDALK
ncbi:SPOR domain-containing protein [Erythrobacter litoralis]|uniref:SPOR domain-containing protein n=1 Tax=Erythrobacter litoralis TaxID=39960 RepID=UPI0024353F0F|nr:SPOR domain-containing protein [Erythrobacter litoralis]